MAQATIVVKFGDDVADSSSYFVTAELDDAVNLDSEGNAKTTFNPGDTVTFLVQHDSRVRIRTVRSSTGNVYTGPSVSRSRDYTVQFTEINEELTLPYIANSKSVSWYDNSASYTDQPDRKIKSSGGSFPAIGAATLSCTFKQFTLIANSIPALSEDDEYLVLIVVYMEVI